MATLNCGFFGLRKNVAENKSYIHVKLTDSAYKAIEEYLKSRDPSNGSPSIFFCGNIGEISIPNRGIGNTKFNFLLQDADQRGSYESVKQSDTRDLESLGPIRAKMKIAAKQIDSFQMTRDRMAADQESSNKKRAKELEPINSNNAFVRQRSIPVTVTGSRKKSTSISLEPGNAKLLTSSNTASLDYKTSYNSTSPNSTNNNTNSNAGNLTVRPHTGPPTGSRKKSLSPGNAQLLTSSNTASLDYKTSYNSTSPNSTNNNTNSNAGNLTVWPHTGPPTGSRKKSLSPGNAQLLTSSNTASLDYKTSYNSTSPNSTNNNNNSNAGNLTVRPPTGPPITSTIKPNPDLVKIPLKDRLIQLLAVKTYNKLEIHSRINNEGCKEKDKKKIITTLMSVSTFKNNIYQLQTIFWGEVKDDWPFYTDEEKDIVSQNKAKRVSPNPRKPSPRQPSQATKESSYTSIGSSHAFGGSSHTSRGSSHTSRGSSHTSRGSSHTSSESNHTPRDSRVASVKRINEDANVLDPIVKKRRGHDGLPVKETNADSYLSSHNQTNSYGDINVVANGQHSHLNTYHGNIDNLNNHHNIKSLDTSKTSPTPLPNYNDFSHNKNGNHNTSSGVSNNDHVDGCNNNNNDKHYNDYLAVPGTYKTPRSSPDSHLDGEENDYLKEYVYITTPEQRTRYKADFNREYTIYGNLYEIIRSITQRYEKLEQELQNEEMDAEEYNILNQERIREYNILQQNKLYLDSKKEYNYLHGKLKHLKQLVVEYDNRPTLYR